MLARRVPGRHVDQGYHWPTVVSRLQLAAELGETVVGGEHYQALFTIGILLFLVTFIVNLSADLIVRGIRKG